MATYSVLIQYSDKDEGYIAVIPEFPGVSAFGKTPEEAVRELETAKQLTMEVYEEDGCALPEPVHLPQYSGQLRLRLPKDLHASLSREAKRNGVSLNTYIVQLLSERNQQAKIQRELKYLNSRISTHDERSAQNRQERHEMWASWSRKPGKRVLVFDGQVTPDDYSPDITDRLAG